MAYSINPTSIVVTWDPPMTPNGIVRFYRIEYTNTTSNDVVDEVNTTNTLVMINMLKSFTTYEVQVFATTITEGDGSDVVRVITDENSKLLADMFICT